MRKLLLKMGKKMRQPKMSTFLLYFWAFQGGFTFLIFWEAKLFSIILNFTA